MIVKAIQDLIKEDPKCSTPLGRWDFGDGNLQPAVFTQDPAPEECPNPVVVITQSATRNWGRSRATHGGAFNINVRLWGDKSESDKPLRKLAMDLWVLLDNCQLVFRNSTFTFKGAIANPPVAIRDGEGFPGYSIDVEVKTNERKKVS